MYSFCKAELMERSEREDTHIHTHREKEREFSICWFIPQMTVKAGPRLV